MSPAPKHFTTFSERHIYGSSRLGVNNLEVELISPVTVSLTSTSRLLGRKNYEISNHLGNVLTVVSDVIIPEDNNTDGEVDGYYADVVSATDYSAFGAPLYGRNWSASDYRYGFNGKEKDDEVKGSGTQYDYGFRIYDSRLARFLSVDPLFRSYPFYTPYQFAGNSPILFIDLDGLERAKPKQNTGKTQLEIYSEKNGRVDIYNPRTKAGKEGKKSRTTSHGFEQSFDPIGSFEPDPVKTGEEPDNSNPLSRDSKYGEDAISNGRNDLRPEYSEGTMIMEYQPGKQENGENETGTFEIGIVDAEGNEKPLQKVTTNKPGTIQADFNLKEGEVLYTRSTGGSTSTGATRVVETEE